MTQKAKCTMGGGISFPLIAILLFPFLKLKAIELSKLCENNPNNCTIASPQAIITNSTDFTSDKTITIQTAITSFINEKDATITAPPSPSSWSDGNTFTLNKGSAISSFTNYGMINSGIYMDDNTSINLANYGTMGGIYTHYSNDPVKINISNFGTINPAVGCYFSSVNGCNGVHFAFGSANVTLVIDKFLIKINQTKDAFTNYKNTGELDDKNSHLSIYYHTAPRTSQVSFKDANSKLIIDFGEKFELGEAYPLNKLITDKNGDSVSYLTADFSRLTLSDEIKDIYELLSSGDDSFIIRLMNKITETPITAIYKANIRTMNNFMTMSNAIIYPRKYNSVILRERSDRRISNNILSLRDLPTANRGNPHIKKSLDSANHLKSYESFSYRNESQTRRIQRHNKRNYSRNLKDSSLRADSQNLRGNPKDLRAKRSNHLPQNLAQNPHDYYFILTPFVNHNLFFESGRYNLSGFDYGFLTAFSARVAESNSLGAHFMMSYGSLGDKQDKDLSIKSLNLNFGLNYKLDLVYDMFLKARGDVFYFSNALDSATLKNIKPNNLGFGASILFGKDFNFKQGGVLGIEAGLDYKALKSNKVSIASQEYQKSLYNIIYADVGLNYTKYFGGFGINLGGGFKANLAPQLAKSILLAHSQNLRFALDNDKFLGYANMGVSYILNARNFDMEFSLAYYGNFGDRVISNGGGFEWRVRW